MYDIIKSIYEFYKENNLKKGVTITFDEQTKTMTIEGGNLTIQELHKEWNDYLKSNPSTDLDFEIEPKEGYITGHAGSDILLAFGSDITTSYTTGKEDECI